MEKVKKPRKSKSEPPAQDEPKIIEDKPKKERKSRITKVPAESN